MRELSVGNCVTPLGQVSELRHDDATKANQAGGNCPLSNTPPPPRTFPVLHLCVYELCILKDSSQKMEDGHFLSMRINSTNGVVVGWGWWWDGGGGLHFHTFTSDVLPLPLKLQKQELVP